MLYSVNSMQMLIYIGGLVDNTLILPLSPIGGVDTFHGLLTCWPRLYFKH